jgi:hypothetical protein
MHTSDTAAQRSAAAHDLAALQLQLLPKCSCISTALMWLLLQLLALLLHPAELLLCYEQDVHTSLTRPAEAPVTAGM